MSEAVYMGDARWASICNRGTALELLRGSCAVGEEGRSDARMSSRTLLCARSAVVARKVAAAALSGGGMGAGAGELMSDEADDQAELLSYGASLSSMAVF